MQIRLRKVGERDPSVIIKGVTFAEIFSDHTEFQSDTDKNSGAIEMNSGRFYFHNDQYDFFALQPNGEMILRSNVGKVKFSIESVIWIAVFAEKIEYQTAGDSMDIQTIPISDGRFIVEKKGYESITMF